MRSIDRGRVTVVVLGVIGALLYANFLLDWVARGFHGMGAVISDLEAPGEAHAVLLRVTDVVCAVAVLLVLPFVGRIRGVASWRRGAVAAMTVFALGAAVAAVVPSPCGPGAPCGPSPQLTVHEAASVVSDTAAYVAMVAMWLATRRAGPVWLARAAAWNFWVGGIVSSAVFGWFNHTGTPTWAAGASQRIHVLALSAWILTLAVAAAAPARMAPEESELDDAELAAAPLA
jgi:hypothetical protein